MPLPLPPSPPQAPPRLLAPPVCAASPSSSESPLGVWENGFFRLHADAEKAPESEVTGPRMPIPTRRGWRIGTPAEEEIWTKRLEEQLAYEKLGWRERMALTAAANKLARKGKKRGKAIAHKLDVQENSQDGRDGGETPLSVPVGDWLDTI
ncbi:hypothetical protein P7C73_g6054, partial [Tremellales sp. Uapishka_1]